MLHVHTCSPAPSYVAHKYYYCTEATEGMMACQASTSCLLLYSHPSSLIYIKVLGTIKGQHMVIMTNIHVNRMARLGGNIWNYAGTECTISEGRYQGCQLIDFFLWPQ